MIGDSVEGRGGRELAHRSERLERVMLRSGDQPLALARDAADLAEEAEERLALRQSRRGGGAAGHPEIGAASSPQTRNLRHGRRDKCAARR